MNATVENGELVIRIQLQTEATPSATGKTLVVATSRGGKQTEAQFNGKPITVIISAYIKK